jgi:hypothetical protein
MPGVDDGHVVTSVRGNLIRISTERWAHVAESHDYMAGNLDKVLETLAEPDEIVAGTMGEVLALRAYKKTSISQKTAVVVYRDEPDGFLITAFFTSRPDKLKRRGPVVWSPT